MSRIGLTIKSTELRAGEVMTLTADEFVLWCPAPGRGWWVSREACRVGHPYMPSENHPAWVISQDVGPEESGTIIAVDVPADPEALAAVCRVGAAGDGPVATELALQFHAHETRSHRLRKGDITGALGCPQEEADAMLIAALRAHPDPLGLLGRAKIAEEWGSDGLFYCRRDIVSGELVAIEAPENGKTRESEDARLLADGWRLL